MVYASHLSYNLLTNHFPSKLSLIRSMLLICCLSFSIPNCQLTSITPDCVGKTNIRYVFEGVRSYNSKFKDEITFFSDHLEYLNGAGKWYLASDTNNEIEDVDTLICIKVSPDGIDIVCDGHINRISYLHGGANFQMMGTFFLLSEGSTAVGLPGNVLLGCR